MSWTIVRVDAPLSQTFEDVLILLNLFLIFFDPASRQLVYQLLPEDVQWTDDGKLRSFSSLHEGRFFGLALLHLRLEELHFND